MNEDVGGEPPDLQLLLREGVLAMIAGSDTTAGVMSNVFYFLISNPEAYKRLQAEVDKME